jgi:hypothetical protein
MLRMSQKYNEKKKIQKQASQKNSIRSLMTRRPRGDVSLSKGCHFIQKKSLVGNVLKKGQSFLPN